MARRCVKCQKRDNSNPFISFHKFLFRRFPTDPAKRKIWLSKLRLGKNKQISELHHVCSQHFRLEYITYNEEGNCILENDAVPKVEPKPKPNRKRKKPKKRRKIRKSVQNPSSKYVKKPELRTEVTDLIPSDTEHEESIKLLDNCASKCKLMDKEDEKVKSVNISEDKQPDIEIKIESETEVKVEKTEEDVFKDCIIKTEEVDFKEEVDGAADDNSNSTVYIINNADEEITQSVGELCNENIQNLYKCTECDYQSLIRQYIQKHKIRHSTAKYKCNICDYQTKYKQSLKQHILRHINPEIHKCTECPYKTIRKFDLKRHVLIHKSAEEIDMNRCTQCSYQTPFKKNLRRHLLVRKGAEEIYMNRCTECSYQTPFKINLRQHLLEHKKLPTKN